MRGAARKGGPYRDPLEGRIGNPIWMDQRGRRRLSRRSLVRIAATVIGVDFDMLWRRHVRRLRWLTALWCALAVLVAATVGTAVWQQNTAQQRSPEQQRAQFLDWLEFEALRGDPTASSSDLKFNVVRVDDLDNDGLLDYFVINETPTFCGSGGCTLEVYLTKSPGDYTMALGLLGSSTPRVRTAADGTKEIATTDFFVSREPLYSIYSIQNEQFQLRHYEFCDGVIFEMCQRLVIDPVPPENASRVANGTVHRERPSADARQVTIGAGNSGSESSWDDSVVMGAVPGGEWYLAQVWKGSCGFVPASALER